MKLSKVSSKYGAPLGRFEIMKDLGDPEALPVMPCHLLPVAIDEGGYDSGGAYWGTPSDLWHLFNAEIEAVPGVIDDYAGGELVELFFRASDKEAAVAEARRICPMPVEVKPYLGDLAMDEFVDGYIECALWSSTYTKQEDGLEASEREHDVPMDRDFNSSDISDEAMERARGECGEFMTGHREDLLAYLEAGRPMSHAGHDFWLSRNGHGTGFRDRGFGELGVRLHAAAKACGEAYLYVGDDGKIHLE